MKKQMGASLIEAMVAVLIIGLGLLGVGAMQSRSIAMNQSAYYRGVAADLGADLAERVRALRSPFRAGDGTATPQPLSPDFSVCKLDSKLDLQCGEQAAGVSHGDTVKTEMKHWNDLRKSQLPPGSEFSLVAVDGETKGFFRYTLTLTWLDNRQDKIDEEKDRNTSYSVVIE
jgi:type IV pilus assembly protein PilV